VILQVVQFDTHTLVISPFVSLFREQELHFWYSREESGALVAHVLPKPGFATLIISCELEDSCDSAVLVMNFDLSCVPAHVSANDVIGIRFPE
jgi:hypothetical protein